MSPGTCPHCGADVPHNATACPECGADETTGWSEKARQDDLGLPDDSFDYEAFVKREFGGEKMKPRGMRWFWWMVAVLVLGLFVWRWMR